MLCQDVKLAALGKRDAVVAPCNAEVPSGYVQVPTREAHGPQGVTRSTGGRRSHTVLKVPSGYL